MICARCGCDELLNDDELCPRCMVLDQWDRMVLDQDRGLFDADELGLDPEEDDERW